jgi:hypothetical protein
VSWDGEEYVLLQKISVSLERIADALEATNCVVHGWEADSVNRFSTHKKQRLEDYLYLNDWKKRKETDSQR